VNEPVAATESALPTRSGFAHAAGGSGRPDWQTGQLADRHVVRHDVEGPILAGGARELADRLVAKYPNPRSALVPLLYLVQSEVGWVPRQGMREVAEILGLRTAEVEAVASFYTMLKLEPCGRYVVSVCTNPSCSLLGARRTYDRAKELLGERAESVTEDGLFTLEEEECLAACDLAPVVSVNYVYYDRVGPEEVERMIASIRDGVVPEAPRGGVPGDLRASSLTLAGVGTLRNAGERSGEAGNGEADGSGRSGGSGQSAGSEDDRPEAGGAAHGPMGEGPAHA
jgi:NADH-quinone oxidoreductase subunit E